MNNLRGETGQVKWTNGSGAAVVSGQIVSLGTRVAVAAVDIASTAVGIVYTQGIFRIAKDGGAITVNAPLDWDFSALNLSASAKSATGDIEDCGAAIAAQDAGDSYVDIDINVYTGATSH